MKVVAYYDFNGGKAAVERMYSAELGELKSVIELVDATLKPKVSEEKTMEGDLLYSPTSINEQFKSLLGEKGWSSRKVPCDYSGCGEYLSGYVQSQSTRPYREMDFLKNGLKLGVEVQFGKYAFMVYNVCAKMTIFRNLDHIDTGIEIVPVKNMADQMSSGVCYFEQFAWDLKHRGEANIDIPVLILGVDA